MTPTRKLYYEDPFLTECSAVVTHVSAQHGVACDRTVAFPEGGGQEGDHGTLVLHEGGEERSIPFTDCQKGLGRVLFLKEFPQIQVDTPVYHSVDAALLSGFGPGMRISIRIDVRRRARLTVNHSALHLVLLGLERLRPGISALICGCHITEGSARLDFAARQRFSPEELQAVAESTSRLVEQRLPIEVFPHRAEPEAWFWRSDGVTIPCGGTHAASTASIGPLRIKRKSMGRSAERIYVETLQPDLSLERYHPLQAAAGA